VTARQLIDEHAGGVWKGRKAKAVVPGATHLFVEAGTLERVARSAAGWFERFVPVHQPVDVRSA